LAMTLEERLQYYLDLTYPIEIIEDENAIVASIPDLPGCNAFGKDVADALRSLKETKELWLRGRISAEQPIPAPSTAEEYSGKFVLRIPRILHRALDREAKKQGTSLNQYVAYLLAERHSLVSFQKYVDQFTSSPPLPSKESSGRKKATKRESADWSHAGLDDRCRDESGTIRRKRSDTLVSALRKTYGEKFATGYRGDVPLSDVLEREGARSLSEYLRKRKI
jgi:antitoxin HicB